MSDSVEKEKIADMPDVSSGSIFPKTICSVELGRAARIGQNAFNACGQLHELTVPESVKTSIGSNALGTGRAAGGFLPRIGVPEGLQIVSQDPVLLLSERINWNWAERCMMYARVSIPYQSHIFFRPEP